MPGQHISSFNKSTDTHNCKSLGWFLSSWNLLPDGRRQIQGNWRDEEMAHLVTTVLTCYNCNTVLQLYREGERRGADQPPPAGSQELGLSVLKPGGPGYTRWVYRVTLYVGVGRQGAQGALPEAAALEGGSALGSPGFPFLLTSSQLTVTLFHPFHFLSFPWLSTFPV